MSNKEIAEILKPECVKDEHLEYLDSLRDSGITGIMWGAISYLQDKYPNLSEDEAKDILLYWMSTYSYRKESEGGD